MSKFATILLKILIVLSFIGIVIFVGIAIFNNQNIAFESYNYIIYTHNSKDFKTLQTNITNNVKTVYGGNSDVYANYINSAITELNEGIDYFLDYLVFEDDLTKGEQDKLTSLYDKYLTGFKTTETSYKTYMQAYENARKQIEENHEEADYAKANVKAKGVSLVRNYVYCYDYGSDFFKYLVSLVNRYNLNGSGLFSYKGQSYMIKVGIVENTLEFVFDNMNKKANDLSYVEVITTNELIDTYYDYLSNAEKYGDDDSVVNTGFRQFINNLNCLNIYDWAGNYQAYTNSLSDELKQKSDSAKTFFNNNFKG